MLVLTRKLNESILIGENIVITVTEIAGGRVKLGITAPRDVSVDRAEVRESRRINGTSKAPVGLRLVRDNGVSRAADKAA